MTSIPQKDPTNDLVQKLSNATGQFVAMTHDILKSPYLADDPTLLQNFTQCTLQLHKLSEEAGGLINEDLEDAGNIIDNILTQPLSIPGANMDVSLLRAAQSYDSSHSDSSDLRKIALSFLQFPEPTKMMVRELELIQKELST